MYSDIFIMTGYIHGFYKNFHNHIYLANKSVIILNYGQKYISPIFPVFINKQAYQFQY